MNFYIFNQLPGMAPAYTVAVLATGEADARRHIKATWRGGSLTGEVESGIVNAHCGATTDAAMAELRRRMEEWQAETDRMIERGELEAI